MIAQTFNEVIDGRLDAIKREGRYRVFTPLQRQCGDFPQAAMFREDMQNRKSITVWCSNDYLAIGQNPEMLKAMHAALEESGAGCGGTRNISGTHRDHVLLEKELAQYHGKERALLFSSGYVANLTCLATLGAQIDGLIIYSDAQNHNSIIEGIRQSRAEKRIFKHNDVKDLKMAMEKDSAQKPKLVVFESVYSMDGDIAPVEEILKVTESQQAMTFLDEVHAVGLYGPQGAGIAARDGVAERIDIIQGTLAKSFGTFGGYIASSHKIVDFLRSFGNGFIFTTSLPPAIIAGARKSLQIVAHAEHLREKQKKNVQYLKKRLLEVKIPFIDGESHIVPVMIGDASVCRKISDVLLSDYGLYMQPINYPTVPRGLERLRLTPSPLHDKKNIDTLIEAFDELWTRWQLRENIERENIEREKQKITETL